MLTRGIRGIDVKAHAERIEENDEIHHSREPTKLKAKHEGGEHCKGRTMGW